MLTCDLVARKRGIPSLGGCQSRSITFTPWSLMDFAMLEEFDEPYQDLLERQLRLILRRLLDPAARG